MKQSITKNIFVPSLLLTGLLAVSGAGCAEMTSNSKDAAVERTRQQVQMLDTLYKTAVVLITEHYVKDPSILPAASASKALFAVMKKGGWHEVRLLGLTDLLFNAENKPSDAFEQAAAEKLLAGETGHEELIEKDGKRYLRVATGIPVVMKQCIMCHTTWEGEKGNIGALSYTVPVIE